MIRHIDVLEHRTRHVLAVRMCRAGSLSVVERSISEFVVELGVYVLASRVQQLSGTGSEKP